MTIGHVNRTPPVLLLVGVHREELSFGQAVASAVDPRQVSVLPILQGLSGRRPNPDEVHRYEMLHRALYLQVLPHVEGRHRLLIDLHTGQDSAGPTADLLCASPVLCQRLEQRIEGHAGVSDRNVRVLPLGPSGRLPKTLTVIPRQIWNNPAFQYLGMEIYLPQNEVAVTESRQLALCLVHMACECVGQGAIEPPGPLLASRVEAGLSAGGAGGELPNAPPDSPGKPLP